MKQKIRKIFTEQKYLNHISESQSREFSGNFYRVFPNEVLF
jgi:hypothetical protein